MSKHPLLDIWPAQHVLSDILDASLIPFTRQQPEATVFESSVTAEILGALQWRSRPTGSL
jgi:hypothetical protein